MAEENLKTVETVDTRPFRKLIMTIGELPTSYIESMTYYELLTWFVNYLETVIIPTINNNGEAVEELQKLYIELHDYVRDYFDNLDVQDEINNKLDQMAEDGQLTQLIAQFLSLNAVMSFQNVAAMKLAENLVNGSTCETYGFYEANDGGSAKYLVRTITNEDTVDEKTIIALYDNTLIAELIREDTMSVKQFGAKGDGTTDDYTAINKAINYTNIIYLPAGDYLINTRIYIPSDKTIYGDGDETVLIAGAIDHILSFVEVTNSKLSDIKIDGKADAKETAGTLSSAIYGINIDYSKNIIIENVTLTNMGYLPQTYGTETGHYGIGGNMIGLNVNESDNDKTDVENCIINNCRFLDPLGRSSFGIRIYTNWSITPPRKYYVKNTKITNCYFEGNNYNNIEIAGQGAIHNIVENCIVKNSKAIVAIEADKGASYNIFNNNILDGLICSSTIKVLAFNCAGYSDDENDYAIGNEFNNNIIKNVTFNTSGTCCAFHVHYARQTIINNILIDGITRYGTDTDGSAIYLADCKDTIITNAIVKNGVGCNGVRILLDTCDDVTIDNCSFDNFNYGVRTSGTQVDNKYAKISNTTFKNIATHGVNLSTGTKCVLINSCNFITCGKGVSFQTGAISSITNSAFKNISDSNHRAIDAINAGSACCEGNLLDSCVIGFTASNLNNRILNNFVLNSVNNQSKSVTYGSNIPSEGQWRVGDIIYNQTPTAGGNIGWVCTTAGTPGTWKTFGSIAA